jgi:hypothetical protein
MSAGFACFCRIRLGMLRRRKAAFCEQVLCAFAPSGRAFARKGFHSANTAIAVNWGIAAVVYLIVGGLIVRLLGRTYRDRPGRRSSYSNEETV